MDVQWAQRIVGTTVDEMWRMLPDKLGTADGELCLITAVCTGTMTRASRRRYGDWQDGGRHATAWVELTPLSPTTTLVEVAVATAAAGAADALADALRAHVEDSTRWPSRQVPTAALARRRRGYRCRAASRAR